MQNVSGPKWNKNGRNFFSFRSRPADEAAEGAAAPKLKVGAALAEEPINRG